MCLKDVLVKNAYVLIGENDCIKVSFALTLICFYTAESLNQAMYYH